jgi:rhodanese-related sulfurtransferase
MSTMKGWVNISPNEVQQLLGNPTVQLIDVRSVNEYREGHIKGVQLIPLDQLDLRTFELDRNKEIVCICRSGARSAKACEILINNGFINVKSMVGGMTDWQGPVEIN